MGLAERKYNPPPRTGMDVFKMLPEGTLAEVINDVIYMSPAPGLEHQLIFGKLFVKIWTQVDQSKLGLCISAPMDVFLDNKNAVQPDIFVIMGDSMAIITEDNKINGTPDLVIEITSPGNRRHDTEKKRALYEKFGVKEYFLIDSENKETITYFLVNNKFVRQESSKGKIKSKLLKKVFSF